MRTTEVKDRLAAQDVEVQASSPPEFAQLIQQNAARWARLVMDALIVLE